MARRALKKRSLIFAEFFESPQKMIDTRKSEYQTVVDYIDNYIERNGWYPTPWMEEDEQEALFLLEAAKSYNPLQPTPPVRQKVFSVLIYHCIRVEHL